MMSEKRFFELDFDEIYYVVDSSELQRKKENFDDDEEFQQYCLENSMSGKEVVNKLNEQDSRIKELEEKMNNDAFELYRHHVVSFGKAVELSAMSYREFIVYADKRGYGCELSL